MQNSDSYLPVEDRDRIDRLADDFEAKFQAGESPVIERYLDRSPELRPHLLKELLNLELELRQSVGEKPLSEDYRRRFPDERELVDRAFSATPSRSERSKAVGADRNLLFGILAWQNGLISESQLLSAMKEWVFNKQRPIGEILVEQHALGQRSCSGLARMVEIHVRLHGNDSAKSLQSLASASGIVDSLREVEDSDLQLSIGHIPPSHRSGDSQLPETVLGQSTSDGTRFRVLRPHAEGGLGSVFVARDEELNREVALKEIKTQYANNVDTQNRFRMEAEITGQLEHPGIVPVYGLGAYCDGRPFYAMRFIRGENLKGAIRLYHTAELDSPERRLVFRDLLQRFIDVCNSIEYAHSRGILHRDLKPGNIMLGKFGETLVVDWGLSRVVEGAENASQGKSLGPIRPESGSDVVKTQYGSVLGTVQYMSPEQASGQLDKLSVATDVYSLGAILYEILTNRPPIQWITDDAGNPDEGATLQAILKGQIAPPRSVVRQTPKPIQAICQKALNTEPDDRYQSAADLAEEVERFLADEPVRAYRESPAKRVTRRLGLYRQPLLSGLIVFFLLLDSLALLAASGFTYGLALGEQRDAGIAVGVVGIFFFIISFMVAAFGVQLGLGVGLFSDLLVRSFCQLLRLRWRPRLLWLAKFGAACGGILPVVAATALCSWLAVEILANWKSNETAQTKFDVANAYMQVARLEATGPVELRDGEQAVQNVRSAIQIQKSGENAESEDNTADQEEDSSFDFQEEHATLAAALAEAGNFDEAIDMQKKTIAEFDDMMGWLYWMPGISDERSQRAERLRLYQHGFAYREEQAATLFDELARFQCTGDPKYRVGDEAVRNATRACELSEWRNYRFIETLAAAHAETGKFEEAQLRQNQAIEVAEETGVSVDERNRLEVTLERFREKRAMDTNLPSADERAEI